MQVRRDFSQIPGLVVLEFSGNAIGPAALLTPEGRSQLLRQRIQQLRDSGEFAYVEPDLILTNAVVPGDSRFQDGTLWGLNNFGQGGGTPGVDVNAVQAWGITTGASSVVVAVIDTGIRYTHRDLQSQVWTNPGEIPGNGVDDDGNGYIDDVHGINAITGSGDPFDDHDHGSHVSGTIGAAANNGYAHVGVAWNVQIMGCKFLTAQGFGATSDAIDCINYAVAMGTKISNNSWGGGGYEQSLFDAISAARDKGHLFIVAAGNSAQNIDIEAVFPASYPIDNILPVAAIDRRGQLADFSCFGKQTVALGAPGVEIFSSASASDEAYDVFDGTSMATPHVAGVAALVLAAHPKADLFELKQRLLNSALSAPLASLKDVTITGGRVDAYNALIGEADGQLELSITPASGTSILTNTTPNVFLRVSDLVPVTNATVNATLNGAGFNNASLSFTNNGVAPDAVANDGTYTAKLTGLTNIGKLTLTLAVTAPGKKGVTNDVIYNIVGPPANDNFSSPRKFATTGGTFDDDNTLATLQSGEPLHAANPFVSHTLWYVWAPTVSGPVLIDVVGTSFDSVLAVYTGSTLSTLKQVAAVDDIGSAKNGYVTFDATAGSNYRIVVGGANATAAGPLRVRVVPNGIPDTSPPTILISSPLNGSAVTTNIIDVTGTAFDNQPSPTGVNPKSISIKVNNGIFTPVGTAVTGPDGTVTWAGRVVLEAGVNTVQAIASDYAENVSNPVTVSFSYRPVGPPNDLFGNAAVIGDTGGTNVTSNAGATFEHGEPKHAGFEGGHSLWWKFTPSVDGVLTLNTTNSSIDTLLGVYVGQFVDQLTAVGSNDDATPGSGYSELRQGVEAGRTYYIAVDGFSGQTGQVVLAYNFRPTTVFSLTVTHSDGGRVRVPGVAFATNDVVQVTAEAEPFFEFVGWEGTVTSLDNPLIFQIKSDTTLHAVFQAKAYTDDFETGNLTRLAYQSAGTLPWTVQSEHAAHGTYAARSGAIGNSQTSSLILVTNMHAGTLSFDYRVSSEAGWDRLQFWVNGVVVQEWSGEIDWSNFAYTVAAGTTKLEWRYLKDNDRLSGEDAAYIDNLLLPVKPAVDSSTAATLTFLGFSSGLPQLKVTGQVAQVYVLQASENLTRWEDVSTNVNTSGTYQVIDSTAKGKPYRFYRTFTPP
jgi:subtilisin family serine protease